jgi:nitrogen regulatory protein P-II 1
MGVLRRGYQKTALGEVEEMKKIEAIIDPSKMEEVKNALAKIGIRRMRVSRVDEFGRQQGHKEFYRAETYMVDVIKEFKIELMVTTDEMLSQVIEAIEKATQTETTEGVDIFVSPVEKVTRLRYPSDCATL